MNGCDEESVTMYFRMKRDLPASAVWVLLHTEHYTRSLQTFFYESVMWPENKKGLVKGAWFSTLLHFSLKNLKTKLKTVQISIRT